MLGIWYVVSIYFKVYYVVLYVCINYVILKD